MVEFSVLTQHTEIFPLLGFLNAFKEPLAASKSCERMCNELVANITGLSIEQNSEDGQSFIRLSLSAQYSHILGLRQLVLLNTLIYGQEGIADSIAKQRLVFFVKHVIPWLQNGTATSSVRGEVCRTLTALLPLMSDLYGEHWGEILNALAAAWEENQGIDEGQERGSNRYAQSISTLIQSMLTLIQPDSICACFTQALCPDTNPHASRRT